jgi:hypothetical protein
LFDANIFYPAKHSLAFSEPLIVPALIGAPLAWLGASPVLVYNIVLLIGFALTAWAVHLLVFEWTNDRAAGILAGSMFAFNSHTLTRLAHMQAIHAWGLPLALLSTDRLIAHARWRDAIWLAVWIACLAYTSGYLVVFGAIMVGVALVARAADWWPRARLVLSRFAGAAVITAVVVLPVYLPYRTVAREMHMVRSLHVVGEYSLKPSGYLASAGRLHYSMWSSRFAENQVDYLLPGFVVFALAIGAVFWAIRSGGSDMRHRVACSSLSRRRACCCRLERTLLYGWIYSLFRRCGAACRGTVRQLVPARDGGARRGWSCCRAPDGAHAAEAESSQPSSFSWPTSNRCAHRSAIRGSMGFPRSIPLLARDPGRVVLVEGLFIKGSVLRERTLRGAQFDGALAAVDERGRGSSCLVSRTRARVTGILFGGEAILAMPAGWRHARHRPSEGFLDQRRRCGARCRQPVSRAVATGGGDSSYPAHDDLICDVQRAPPNPNSRALSR